MVSLIQMVTFFFKNAYTSIKKIYNIDIYMGHMGQLSSFNRKHMGQRKKHTGRLSSFNRKRMGQYCPGSDRSWPIIVPSLFY